MNPDPENVLRDSAWGNSHPDPFDLHDAMTADYLAEDAEVIEALADGAGVRVEPGTVTDTAARQRHVAGLLRHWSADPEFEAERAALVAAENDRRRMLYPVRLDAELWQPPVQFHTRTVSHEAEDARREWRRAQRPFRRAFGGGELRRRILLKVGVSNAKRAGS